MVQLHSGELCSTVQYVLTWKALQGSEECVMPTFVSTEDGERIYMFICICFKYLRKDAQKLLALVASEVENSVLGDRSRSETSSMSFHAFEFEQCESISSLSNWNDQERNQISRKNYIMHVKGVYIANIQKMVAAVITSGREYIGRWFHKV